MQRIAPQSKAVDWLALFKGGGIILDRKGSVCGDFEHRARLRRLAVALAECCWVWRHADDHADDGTSDAAHFEAMERMPGMCKEAEALGIHFRLTLVDEYADANETRPT